MRPMAAPMSSIASEAGVPHVRERNDALDFTKGTLVILMVIYHWLNYFVELQWDVYRYLRFLTPSFIFISGFIISAIYSPALASQHSQINRRLWQRGLKLLALFTALNLLVMLLSPQSADASPLRLATVGERVFAVYVTGNGRAVFDVLVPIAYFLMFAPFLLMASRRVPGSLAVMVSGTLILACVQSLRGEPVANLELLAIAFLGMLIGTMSLQRILNLAKPAAIVGGYGLYLMAIAVWNVLFPLQIAGVCLSLLLLYLVGVWAGPRGWLARTLIQLGRYSLLSYIGQVVILQLLRRVLRPVGLEGVGLLVPFFLTLALTVASVVLLDWLRPRAGFVDRVYRTVFA